MIILFTRSKCQFQIYILKNFKMFPTRRNGKVCVVVRSGFQIWSFHTDIYHTETSYCGHYNISIKYAKTSYDIKIYLEKVEFQIHFWRNEHFILYDWHGLCMYLWLALNSLNNPEQYQSCIYNTEQQQDYFFSVHVLNAHMNMKTSMHTHNVKMCP